MTITTGTDLLLIAQDKIYLNANTVLNVNGAFTTINNLAASSHTGYVLLSDGTSYTPTNLFGRENTWSAYQSFSNAIALTSYVNVSTTSNVSVTSKNRVRATTTSGTITVTLTGMTDGQPLLVTNLGGTYSATVGGITIAAGTSKLIWYDGVSSVWRSTN
jgi:hypothetical protein